MQRPPLLHMRGDSADTLLLAQQALRSRFDDFRQAFDRNDRTALQVALLDFEEQFRRWTEAEEKTLVPALTRNGIPGRDPQRELHLEYVQIRELTRYLVRQLGEGIRANDLAGFVENLDRRLRAHESEMEQVYYPAARTILTAQELSILDSARPE
jgi:Hemerythrin HHE cation binding domain